MLRVRTLFILSVTRVLSLLFYFILSLHFTPGLQSAVCILPSVCILPPVCSLQSAVCSLRFTLTVQQIKSRIKEIKEDEHTNSLAKIQVCAMFRGGDIRGSVSLKFIRLFIVTPCLCPSAGHKYGGRKLTKFA